MEKILNNSEPTQKWSTSQNEYCVAGQPFLYDKIPQLNPWGSGEVKQSSLSVFSHSTPIWPTNTLGESFMITIELDQDRGPIT